MGWGNNDGSADVDGGAVGGTAGNASGPGPGEAEGTGFGGEIGGYSGYGGGAGVGPHGTQAAGPTMGMMDQAGDMNAAAMAGGLVDSAGGMEFGGQGVVGSQGNIAGSQHAGTAGDSFSDAVAALDAAIGSMPNLESVAPIAQAAVGPSTGLPGMGYAEGQIAAPGMEAFGGYGLEGAAPGIGAFGGYGPGGWGGGTTQGGVAAPGIGAFGGYSADPGLEAFGGLGTQQGPGVGYGTGALGEMGNPTNTVDPGLQAANAAALSQSQGLTADVGWAGAGTPTNVGNPMGYGMYGAPATAAEEGSLDGIAQSAQDQRSAAAQTIGNIEQESDNAFDVSQYGQLSMNQQQAPGRTDAEGGGPIGAANMSQAEADALDGWSGGLQATGQDIDTEDENEDYSGLPTGMTAEQTNMIVAGLKDAETGKGFAYALNEMARAALGLPPSTPESRMKDALSNYDAQGQQEAMEMDVSTGEDDRTRRAKLQAVSDFRKKYKWAANMSPKEIQAYIDNPALLNLKTSNEQMKSMDPKNMTANDIRQLWSPAMSA